MKDFRNKYRSKSNRLEGFDYTLGFWYFITICTKNKFQIFGEIKDGNLTLNKFGEIGKKCWEELPKHVPVSLDKYVIMPNHMHGIIILENKINVETQHAVSLRETQQSKMINVYRVSTENIEPAFGKHIKGSLGVAVRSYKSAVTREINKLRNSEGKQVWQSNYYDRIIRNEKELYRIRNYIQNNPLQWEIEREENIDL